MNVVDNIRLLEGASDSKKGSIGLFSLEFYVHKVNCYIFIDCSHKLAGNKDLGSTGIVLQLLIFCGEQGMQGGIEWQRWPTCITSACTQSKGPTNEGFGD